MNDFDESNFSVALEPTHGDFLDLDEDGNPIPLNGEKYALTSREELCFKCPLPDCKENSNKCLINISIAKQVG